MDSPCSHLTHLETGIAEIVDYVAKLEGYLQPREIEFLALLAARPTARGEILEVGSYVGKSTIALARGAALAGDGKVVTVDPLRMSGAKERFLSNLANAGVREQVEYHQMTSEQLGRRWQRPLRLLWIDGDHSYRLKRLDFDTFAHHLADGGIIAFHDVLNRLEGPVRVFMERVLLSDHFGALGICGSIGWAQFREQAAASAAYRKRKRRIYRQLGRLVPAVAHADRPRSTGKLKHRFFRALVPHGRVNVQSWLKQVA